ncbi:hypothetical protein [Marinomonas sp. BSi20584]|uniref:hypothetical protein n=2 Tax=Marinomonas TaxID=28253 RepID=UPI000C1E73EC|nr:hypothetical protein [Marinomonas sp. BSi20584]PJE54463.1 hypothetical protein TY87_15815 [Marinomonas sp. BSi20584]
MSFKDGSWWVCCTFIIIISYTFGTLTGFPIWSATDSKLSVFLNFTTSLAAIATLAAAFYAYKSFNSWEERIKKQHRLEQSAIALKELSQSYNAMMIDVRQLLINNSHDNKIECDLEKATNSREQEKAIDLLSRLSMERRSITMNSIEKFHVSSSAFASQLINCEAFNFKNISSIPTAADTHRFLETIMEKRETELSAEDSNKVASFNKKGIEGIRSLFKEIYSPD